MRTGPVLLVVLAAALALTTATAAGPESTRQRIAIGAAIMPSQEFVLTPFKAGALKRDEGTFTGNWRNAPGKELVRNGVKVGIYTNTWTLDGERGTLTIRERIEWRDTGADGNGDGNDDGVAFGSWSVVRGKGAYAGLKGSGGSAHAGLGNPWNARFEGFLTR